MAPDTVTPAELVAKVEALVFVIKPVTLVQGADEQPKVLSNVTLPGNLASPVPMARVQITEPADLAV